MTFDFYYDFESPFAYLASTQIAQLCERTGAQCNYKPVFLGGIMQATGNRPPASVNAKGRYLMTELTSWAEIFGVPLRWPVHFPLGRELRPIRGALHAFKQSQQLGVAYTEAVYRAHWGEHQDLKSDQVMQQVAESVGIDFGELSAAVQTPEIKEQLKRVTGAAVERGLFGVPVFFVEDRMFWGVDKLPWVEAALRQQPLALPKC